MKKIILSEEQIQKVCESYKNWRGYEDYKSYQAEDELENQVKHQTIDDLKKREYSTIVDVLVNDKKKKKNKKNKNKKS